MPKTNVKIFVSHRIDIGSEVVENSVYQPVRCGACFDSNDAGKIRGDNTGENISSERMRVGEFTVQYWAWKNIEADYYGICHYRRYLSFSDERYETDEKNQVIEPFLNKKTIQKYRLDEPEYISEYVSSYDAVVSEYASVERMYTPRGFQKNVYDHFAANDGLLIYKEDIELLLSVLEKLYPEIGACGRKYFAGNKFRGYNCFILKRKYFFELCQIECDVLEEIYKSGLISFENRTETQSRTYGFFTEWLYGIYLYYLENKTSAKIKAVQLVFFENTEKSQQVQLDEHFIQMALAVEEHNVPTATVTIQSILNSSFEEKICVTILHRNLSESVQKRMKGYFINERRLTINFVNYYKILGCSPLCYVWSSDVEPECAIMLLPWLLPETNKVLYFNSCSVVKENIRNLYEIVGKGTLAAAPLDMFKIAENNYDRRILRNRKEVLSLRNPYEFYSSNLMLLSLSEIRKRVSFEQMVEGIEKTKNLQDSFNYMLNGLIEQISLKWLVCPPMSAKMYQMCTYIPKNLMDQLRSVQDRAGIICFSTGEPPIPEVVMSEEFWKIARGMPVYESLLRWNYATYPLEQSIDTRSGARKLADKFFPKNTLRRRILKKIIPKESNRWNFLKKIYHTVFKK